MLRRLAPLAALIALLALAAPSPAAASTGGDGEDPIVVFSGDVSVPRGETVEGVYVVSGDATIAGRVDGDVVVLSGEVTLSGTVEGDVFAASGLARLLPSAEVTGDVSYGDERPQVSLDARVHGDVGKQGWPDLGGLLTWIGGFLVWLAVSVSLALLGLLLLLAAPRAADAVGARARQRIGPTIAIGIAIAIALPVGAAIAAVTVLALPLAIGVFLTLLPLGAVAYVTAAWALGRAILKPPRQRALSLLAGVAILRAAALVPFLGLLVGLGAVIVGLGLLGAAIGTARDPADPAAARSPGS